MLLRDYVPYDPSSLRIRRLEDEPPNPGEREHMDDRVAEILDSFTVEDYFERDPRVAESRRYIETVLARMPRPIGGRVLEFAAGTCKAAALVSRLDAVEEVVCVDFSEPLLLEIAPRVISWLGGALEKFVFVVGDMNSLPETGEKLDWLLGYYAVHHLDDPAGFLREMRPLIRAGGGVLCLREPALATVSLPSAAVREYRAAQARKEQLGDFERIYSPGQYRAMARDRYRFERLDRPAGWRRQVKRELQDRIWNAPYDVAYLLTPRR